MAHRILLREQQSQPQGPAEAALSGPAQYFDWIWKGSAVGLDVAKGNAPIITRRANGASTSAGPFGMCVRGSGTIPGAASGYETAPGAVYLNGQTQATVFALIEFTALTVGSSEYCVIRTDQNSDPASGTWALNYFVDSASAFRIRPLVCTLNVNGWSAGVDVTVGMPKLNTLYVLGFRYSSGSSFQVCLAPVGGPLNWVNAGMQPVGVITSTGAASTGHQTHFMGAASTSAAIPPARLYGAAVAKRAVPTPMMQQIVANPWLLLAPARQHIFFSGTSIISVGNSGNPVYNILGSAGLAGTASYSVRQTASNLLAHNYYIRTDVTQAVGLSYNVQQSIATSVGESYSIRQLASSDVTQNFVVRSLVSSAGSESYAVRQLAVESKGQTYNVLQLADKIGSQSYNVRQASTTNFTTLYEIFSGTAVGRSINSAYNIRGSAGVSSVGSYTVLQAVQFGNTTSYVVRTSVPNESSQVFIVRTQSAANSGSAYSIRTTAAANRQAQYTIQGTIPVGTSLQVVYSFLNAIVDQNTVVVTIQLVPTVDIVLDASKPDVIIKLPQTRNIND